MKLIFQLLLCIFLATPVYAQTEEVDYLRMSIEDLLRVDVAPFAELVNPMLDTAVMTKLITQAMIRDAGYKSLVEVLSDLPEVYATLNESGLKKHSEVILRAKTKQTKLIIMVDGKMVKPSGGKQFTLLLNIILGDIQQIEYSFGTTSGGNAGIKTCIINIITTDYRSGSALRQAGKMGQCNLIIGRNSDTINVGELG